MSEKKWRRRAIVVPANDYQPTKAEMEEPITLDGNVPLDEAVGRLLQPVEVDEIRVEDWRSVAADE